MTLPRTVDDVLTRHVSFEIESIDRMYCNVYQPRLQHPRAVAGFIRHHLGFPVASSAVLAPISEAFVTAVRVFARVRDAARAYQHALDDLTRQASLVA